MHRLSPSGKGPSELDFEEIGKRGIQQPRISPNKTATEKSESANAVQFVALEGLVTKETCPEERLELRVPVTAFSALLPNY